MREGIRFVLGSETREIAEIDPATTVLRYLREVERRVGTKEGCAEGDCGACTVALGEWTPDGVVYKAVNACIQFVPMLDGKHLLTVEDLRRDGDDAHPVVTAMCEAHASQCGFCTPGFVMSLCTQHLNGAVPDRAGLKDALAGNLCRCTGYGPILDAGERLGAAELDSPDYAGQLADWAGTEGVTISGDGRHFHAPATLADFARLREDNPDALIVSGLSDVGLWVTKQHRDLPDLLYIGAVEELRRLRVTDTHIDIGAAVTLSQAHHALSNEHRDLGELVRRFASLQIRNVATVCGNIANGSPIGDLAPALIALGADLELRKGTQTRTIALEDFFIDYGVQDLRPGEFVSRVRVPRRSNDREFRCYKLSKRFDQDISAVCGAFAFSLDDGTVREPRICFGGMAAIPKRAVHAEAALDGAAWTQDTVDAARMALAEDYAPLSDMRGSALYRLTAARNLFVKVFNETSGFTGQTRVLDYCEADRE